MQVTLQILTALIEKLPRDLPLYAQSVLTILNIVIHSNEISMVEESIPTFEVFCSHQDTATLAADQDYINQYRDVVRRYASFASSDTSLFTKTPLTPPMVLRWRTVGLQAIKSVVSSEALSTDGNKQLNVVIPVVLQNLYANGDPVLSPLQQKAQTVEKQEREQARRRRMSIATVQTVDTVDGNPTSASGSAADADKAAEIEARVLALRCLERIFTAGSNRGQIRLATALVLNFIVSRRPPRGNESKESVGRSNRGNWATNLLEVITNWTPVQDRFIILITVMETLVDRPLTDGHLDPELTLASMMEWLLSSPINLIGLSVMDVLLALLRYSLLLLHLGGRTQKLVPPLRTSPFIQALPQVDEEPSRDGKQRSDTPDSVSAPMRQELLDLLQGCIGNLATHIYYGDQVSDMIKAIVSRLKPSKAPTSSSGEPAAEAESANGKAEQTQDSSSDTLFSFPEARVVALKSIKDILVVANLHNSATGGGPDSRNRVPIHVWESTQWLLRDADKDVRHAFVDAFLYWLQFETNESDLRAPVEPLRITKGAARRDAFEPSDKLAKRVVSKAVQADKPGVESSRFLQLLHFVIYDNASDPTATASDFSLLHLLLVSLVENMGVNATRYGLPVIMSLQSFYLDPTNSVTPLMALRIGSLVHGYLCAVAEKFELEGTRVGNEIINEITRRRREGIWLDNIQLPPRPMTHFYPASEYSSDQDDLPPANKSYYIPFKSLKELVSQIEMIYNTSILTPSASPAGSPGRAFSLSPIGQAYDTPPHARVPAGSQLPSYIKDQMLSVWSRDACLAAMEDEKAMSSSISGSRAGTGAVRNHFSANVYKNGNGSPTATDSSIFNRRYQQSERPISAAHRPASGYGDGGRKSRRQSVPDVSQSATGSSRDSTLRVNELRRVLSVINNTSVRHPSPLRNRPRRGSDVSSTDTMATDNFSNSDAGATAAGVVLERVQPANLEQDTFTIDSERGNEGVSGVHQNGNDNEFQTHSESDIPPVPPLPSSLVIPGGFPADSVSGSNNPSPSHSPSPMDRPATAPSARPTRMPSKDLKSNAPSVRQSRSLTRQKQRAAVNGKDPSYATRSLSRKSSLRRNEDGAEPLPTNYEEEADTHSPQHGLTRSRSMTKDSASRTMSFGRRVDVDKLLEGLVVNNGESQATNMNGNEGAGPHPSTATRKKKEYKFTDADYRDSSPGASRFQPPRPRSIAPSTSMRRGIGPPPY